VNGFERRKEQKKESIRRAALELFMLYGFKKVSINDIAGKAGVSPVTIYNHFGSKDELVREVVKMQLFEMMEKYRAIINGEGSFPEKLETIVFDKTEIASGFRGELATVVLRDDPEMKRFVDEEVMQTSTRMTLDLFEEGKKEGYVSSELSQETLVIFLELFRNGIAASTRLFENMESYPRLVRELNQLILYGLIGNKKPSS